MGKNSLCIYVFHYILFRLRHVKIIVWMGISACSKHNSINNYLNISAVYTLYRKHLVKTTIS